MPDYTLNRNYTLRSTSGVISFVKGEPTNVPPFMEKEVVMIGAEAVGKATPSLVPEMEDKTPVPEGQDRMAQIQTAISLIVEKNDAADFTGSGAPTVKAVENIVGFDVVRGEVVAAWTQFNAENN